MVRPLLVIAAVLSGCAAVPAYWFWTHRLVRSEADLLRYLPPGEGTTVYVNARQLARAGQTGVFSIVQAAQSEADYSQFVRQTGFDYGRDLDALAAKLSVDWAQVTVVLKGRFEWPRLRSYAASHGGRCPPDGPCQVRSRDTGRLLTFYPIQPDVLAAQIGARALLVRQSKAPEPPTSPVAVTLTRDVLQRTDAWPLPLRLLAAVLAPASPLHLTIDPAAETSPAAFLVDLQAEAATPAAATAIRTQLELQAKLVQLQLARAQKKAGPGDLLELFTSGEFNTNGRTLRASWPVTRQLLERLQ